MVLMAITTVLKKMAMGDGTMFVAPRKAKGTARTAPTRVPRKAMHSVSTRR